MSSSILRFEGQRHHRPLNVLLVEPRKSKKYHTPYPPLGLLKLAAYHRERGDRVKLVNGTSKNGFDPDVVHVTSLFTYAWEPVHGVVRFYSTEYPKAMVVVGGIYASLCPGHLRDTFGDRMEIHQGLLPEIEGLLPDYSLVPEWETSILFSSRGCIRDCSFCSVPQLEPKHEARGSIRNLIYPGHTKAILWDNNILASPHWRTIFAEFEEMGLEVDFNQGLDARLLDEDVAVKLTSLRLPVARLAYDSEGIREPLKKAIDLLKSTGRSGRRIIVYCLYGYLDTPEAFLDRVRDLVTWGVVTYPLRFQPLALISDVWT